MQQAVSQARRTLPSMGKAWLAVLKANRPSLGLQPLPFRLSPCLSCEPCRAAERATALERWAGHVAAAEGRPWTAAGLLVAAGALGSAHQMLRQVGHALLLLPLPPPLLHHGAPCVADRCVPCRVMISSGEVAMLTLTCPQLLL